MNHFEKFDSYIPFDLLEPAHLATAFVVLLAIVNFRYFLFVGAFWWTFYKSSRPRGQAIYKNLPNSQSQRFEIRWSLVSSVIFALTGCVLGWAWQHGWTRIYLPLDHGTYLYLPLSALILAILHDAYFYWMHRALHTPRFYRWFHGIHHASTSPSPWASFSFHPIESLLNALAVPLIAVVLPLHPLVILWHLTLMTLTAITNHLGFEILPSRNPQNWWVRNLVSGVHHCEHHRFFKFNYALFFSWWDRACGTERPQFAEDYAKVTNGEPLW
jgi:sterol desaturase/sphingolipid hydroxylase (fatty acid hydroxylase superfamily)